MMYNDVDNDLPPFNDSIDGEEIFLFSNTKTSSTGVSFLHEDDDEHLRHQHNVVASTSTHLPVDVDELLLNSNFLEQPSCDQSEDPLFWNCKDISDDHLNEFLPTQSQINLSNSSSGNNNNTNNTTTNTTTNNNNNNNSNNNNSNSNNTTSTNNNHHHNNNSISINLSIPQQQSQISLNQHSQAIIPIQHLHAAPLVQQVTATTTVAQPPLHHQLRLQPNQIQQQQVTTLQQQSTQLQQQQQQAQQQQSGFQQQQIIQHDQFQTKWITLVHTNDQYQAFTTAQPTFFDKTSQTLIHSDVAPTLHNSIATLVSTHGHIQAPLQQQPPPQQQQQQQQPPLQLQQHTQQQPQHLQPTIIQLAQPPTIQVQPQQQQQQPIASVPPYQHSLSQEQKPSKTSAPTSNGTSKKDASAKPKPKEKQTRLDCPYCKRSFSKNFDLQQHMRCHTGEKPFQCIVCGRGFAQKSNVKKHMQAHKVWPEGPNNPPLPSNHGSARSRNNSASSSIGTPRDDECMQENESVQIDDNNLNNNTIVLGMNDDRKNEGNDIFAENRYSCSYCQFNGRTYFELKSHLTIHKREKVFKCIVSSCGKTFSGSDLEGFLNHVKCHKDLIYHCHLCSGQFYSLAEFGQHQKHHSNAQIKRTSQSQSQTQSQQQTSVSVLNQQNASLRQQNQQVAPTQLQPQQNQRQYNQQQQQQQQAQQTQQSNNQQKNTQLYNNQQARNNQKFFRCSKCMNRYTTQTALDHHLSISTHNFPCTECNKVFMCERYLRRHLNTHTSVQHVCTFCDKQFKTASYLKMHSVVHTGEKPFRCNLCEAAFNRRDKLNRHKLTHETVKKYKCPYRPHIGCTKEFNRPDKLKAHLQTHTGSRPHPCDSCARTFTRLSRLRDHKRLHHNISNGVGGSGNITSTTAKIVTVTTVTAATNTTTTGATVATTTIATAPTTTTTAT